MLDLKFYSEITSKYAKSMCKSSSYSSDRYYGEKYEVVKCLETRFKVGKIYYSKSLESFIIIFESKYDEKEVYLTLADIKHTYNNMELDLSMDFENVGIEYTIKIGYSKKLLSI